MKLLKFFRRKKLVTFHLKSGCAVSIRCDDLSIEQRDNELLSYQANGIAGIEAFYIRLDDVSAITVKR